MLVFEIKALIYHKYCVLFGAVSPPSMMHLYMYFYMHLGSFLYFFIFYFYLVCSTCKYEWGGFKESYLLGFIFLFLGVGV